MPIQTLFPGTFFKTSAPSSFQDDFNRADGSLGSSWSGATWAIVSNKAVNTPATLGSTIITNGNMELDANWINSGTPTVNAQSNTEAHNGTYSRHFTTDVVFEGIKQNNITAVAQKWYALRIWSKSSQSLYITIVRGDGSGTYDGTITGTGSWVQKLIVWREVGGGNFGEVQIRSLDTAITDAYIDDVSMQALTLGELLNLISTSVANLTISIAVTLTIGASGGVALNWDSRISPANGVVAYHDGTRAILEKCVAGVWTTVISVSRTYAAGRVVKVVKSGTSYSLFYGPAGSETQVGTTQTISDSGIVNNLYHGLFATDALVSLDNFNLS